MRAHYANHETKVKRIFIFDSEKISLHYRRMTLKKYLHARKFQGFTLAHEAVRFGISQSYLCEIKNGNKTPAMKVALRIRQLSGNKVSLESMAALSDTEP